MLAPLAPAPPANSARQSLAPPRLARGGEGGSVRGVAHRAAARFLSAFVPPALGLDFLAITDHNTTSQHRESDRWPDLITPIRGSEVTTFHGHLNCFGLHKAIDWRDAGRGGGAAAIADQAHRQDALISINHPSAFGDPWCTGCHWDFALVDYSTIDAIEVWNGRWAIPETANLGALAFWTDLLDAGLRPTGVSGTDSHSAEEDQYPALPMTYVHAGDGSEGSILDGIRRGRVFLSSGPIVSFQARGSDGVDVVLPGEHLPADGTFDLSADVAQVDAPATLWYVTSGSVSPSGNVGRQPRVSSTSGWSRRSGGASNCARDRLPPGTFSRSRIRCT